MPFIRNIHLSNTVISEYVMDKRHFTGFELKKSFSNIIWCKSHQVGI